MSGISKVKQIPENLRECVVSGDSYLYSFEEGLCLFTAEVSIVSKSTNGCNVRIDKISDSKNCHLKLGDITFANWLDLYLL